MTFRLLRAGIRGSWARRRVMPRLLDAPPLKSTVDARVEVHVPVGRASWLEALWAVRSFYHAAERQYRLCLHDDGTLDDESAGALAYQLPHARLALREAANSDAATALSNFPSLLALRKTGAPTRFFVDVAWANAGTTALLISPGVLFLSSPVALLSRAEDARYPSAAALDFKSRYVLEADAAEQALGIRPLPLMHSALAVIRPSALSLERLDALAQHPRLATGESGDAMRTMLALALSGDGAELLPGEYAVRRDRETALGVVGCYEYPVGRLYFREGMAALLASGFRAAHGL